MGSLTLTSRQKKRRLPQVDAPVIEGNDELRRFTESIKEHLRMYEGDSGAPKERFVTIEELEHVGLVTTKVQQGFASIDKIFGQQINAVPSATPVAAGLGGAGGVRTLRALDDTQINGISGGQGIVWNGNIFVPTEIPEFSLDNATRYDMIYFDGEKWVDTKQELQWNPTDDYLQLENAHSINWLDPDGVSIELEIFSSASTDPNLDDTILVVTADDSSEDATTFTSELGGHNFTATVAGGGVAKITSAESLFGTFSIFCDDAAGAVKARWGMGANSTSFDFAALDWTMECHLLFERKSNTTIPIFAKWIWLDQSFLWTFDSTAEIFTFTWSPNGTSTGGGTSIAWPVDTYVTGQWYHMAVAREGNTLRFFLDGVLCGTTEDTTGVTFFTADQQFEIFSKESNGAGDHATYMSNARITKGVARYTATFTPPTSAPPIADEVAFTLGDPAVTMNLDASEIRIRGVVTPANYLAIDHDDTDINIVGVNTTDINIDGITAFNLHGGTLAVWDSSKTDNITLEHDGSFGIIGGTNMTRTYFQDSGDYHFFDSGNTVSWKVGVGATQILIENSLAHTVAFWEDGDGNLYYTFNFNGTNGEGFTIHRGNKLAIRGTTGANEVEIRHDNTDFNWVANNTTDWNITGITALNAGSMDADFDAITATSYGGITEANLVDKTAVETIAGVWTFEAGNLIFETGVANPSHTEGLMYYDDTIHAVSYYNEEADVAVNLGQENLVRVRNASGSTITNGQLVYISGQVGNRPKVELAKADALATAQVLGMATHDIENNTDGYITTLGTVNLLNTSGDTEGAQIYLSEATAGDYTETAPTGASEFIVPLGFIMTANVATGRIYVSVAAALPHPAALSSFSGSTIFSASDGDMLHRDAGVWKNTAGALTWDGSIFATTGVVSIPAGAVGTPPLYFTGDSDTGVWSPGADIFALAAGAIEAVRYTEASSHILADHSMESGITASTTQTQGQRPLLSSYNEISVCANNDDVVTMPPASKGRRCLVINKGAKRLKLFPASGDDIGAGVDTAVTIKVNTSLLFMGIDGTTWHDVATRLESLQGVDLTGAADNDLLHRSAGDWIDTAGALTFDGTDFVCGGMITAGSYIQPALVTTANLADITHAINTAAGKGQGATVYNSTTDMPVYAKGSADGDVWVDGAGTTVHTPV